MKPFVRKITAACLACFLILSLCSCSLVDFEPEDLLEMFLPETQTQTRFFLNTEFLTMVKEDTFALSVTAKAGATPPSYSIEWLSDNSDIVTVNDGVLYAVAQGVTNVRARLTVNASTPYTKDLVCTVTVTQNDVSLIALDLNTTSLTLTTGDADKLTPIFTPANTTETSVRWASSDPSVVTVGADGTVVANKVGTVNILVYSETNENISASCKITVEKSSENQVKSIKLNTASASLKIGETKTLKATVSATSFKGNVTWSSDNMDVATVTQDGVVTAVAKGSTYITASAGNKSASCKITVSNTESAVIPCTGVTLDRTEVRVVDGPTTFKLSAVCTPLNTTEVGTWSTSNAKVASVTAGGTVSVPSQATATEIMTAVIKYTVSGSVYATCTVTVIPSSLLAGSVTLSQTTAALAPEDTLPLTFTTEKATTADRWVWKTSDETVATVSETGVVTAIGKGTATITLSSQDRPAVKATCTVTVAPINVNVTLTTDSGEDVITSYDDILLRAVFSDKMAMPDHAEYTLSVNNSNATLKEATYTTPYDYVLTPVASGKVVVSLTIQSDRARYVYTCTPVSLEIALPAISGITFEEEEISLTETEEKDLIVHILSEEYVGNCPLTFRSSDKTVVTVSEDGQLYAVAEGTATITVAIKDNSDISATCTVTVTKSATSDATEETPSDAEEPTPSDAEE